MFDNVTRALIEQAVPLSGIDMSRLPQNLTATYGKIVSMRVAGQDADDLNQEIDKIERIGNTYLALLLSGHNEHFQSIAFVAASAFSLVASYRSNESIRHFDRDSVCPLCISALLYIAADAISDATEVATNIPEIEDPVSIHDKVSQYIRQLSLGNLANIALEDLFFASEGDSETIATAALFHKCMEGVRDLSRALLQDSSGSVVDALAILKNVKEMSVEDVGPNFADSFLGNGTFSVFAGPFILASLLAIAADRLIFHSLVNIPIPSELFVDEWQEHIKRIAYARPYIWPNHARAIHDKGVLQSGISAVFSLPTGAGKTTLSNLKIASVLAEKGKTIFLAPTHALVQQVSNDLRQVFPRHSVKNAILDGEYVETEDVELADIAVMTPERCLAFLMFFPAAFEQVKLVVFDECHILHSGDLKRSHRASDSMMCLHRLFEHAPHADYFLLSAMIANAEDIAGWIEERTSRKCFAIQDEWKPTRQLKGCVVYQKSDLEGLRSELTRDRVGARKAKRKSPGAVVKRKLNIRPWAFFGLNQTWSTSKVADYLALPISDEEVLLNTNKYWRVSPNKNVVASALATVLHESYIKTLIFVQQIDHTQSIVKNMTTKDDTGVKYTADEMKLVRRITEELGNLKISYVPQGGVAACHHGLLLKEERELVEKVFRRSDGFGVLAATPTLAQGMNLPAEAVILAGDERWDAEQNDQAHLEAHELLNAAGRAGRAGVSSKGFVLVIPSKVVSLEYSNDGGASIGREWTALKDRTFSKSDQCLTVIDPLAKLLDVVQDSADSEDAVQYLFRRMPYKEDRSDAENVQDVFNNSLAAFMARKKDQAEAFNLLTQKAVSVSQNIRDFDKVEDFPWMGALAAEIGIDTQSVQSIYQILEGVSARFSVYDYLDWAHSSGVLSLLIRHTSHVEIVKDLTTPEERKGDDSAVIAYGRLLEGLKAWCGGETIFSISEIILENSKSKSKCKNSRKLAIRWAPEVAYALGSVARMYRYKCEEENVQMPLCLATVASLIRHGVDSPEKLALLHIHEYELTRPGVNDLYVNLSTNVPEIDPYSSFPDVLRTMNTALDLAGW